MTTSTKTAPHRSGSTPLVVAPARSRREIVWGLRPGLSPAERRALRQLRRHA